MKQSYLIKYGEIGIKGKNRHLFEDALIRQMKRKLKKITDDVLVYKTMGRIYVQVDWQDEEEIIAALKEVFGIVGICPMVEASYGDYESLEKFVCDYMKVNYPSTSTFKVNVRRPNKKFPFNTMELNAKLGEAILRELPHLKVDVHHPEIMVNVEIRESFQLYTKVIAGQGGMPLGTNGKAMLLLSGGIDSPVAGYMIGRRGVEIDGIYFHAPPYTSERAREKVLDLGRKVSKFTGPMNLLTINFTKIQMKIYEICPHEELTIIMRRYMMKIAQHFANEGGHLALITGENLGQVASQTIHSLGVTNEVCSLPVFRPLIGLDKQDIVDIAKRIDTFETSILPYEDCCTIFVAKHPVTKPMLSKIKASEALLDGIIEPLLEEAIETAVVERIR